MTHANETRWADCHHGQMRDFGFVVPQRYKVHLPKAEQFICDGSYESVKFRNSDNKLVALTNFQKTPNRIVGGGGLQKLPQVFRVRCQTAEDGDLKPSDF